MEIMIVVAIIGLLSSIGIPGMLRAGVESRNKRFASEIKTAGHAFVQYAFETGGYPADKLPAQMPDGMESYLSKLNWAEETVIGGNWDWDYQQFGVLAAVSVKDPNWDSSRMMKIDSIIDDGNLATGQFRSRANGYMYVLEENP